MTNPMLTAALSYLERGLSVIPIRRDNKKPCLESWLEFQNRLPLKHEAEGWWGIEYPDANVAIVTGKNSGVLVVDIDGPEGVENAKKLHLPHSGPLVKTARGWHLYFQYPPGGGRNYVGTGERKGIDCRAEGGYSVAPPSIHKNGAVYTWERGLNSKLPLPPENIITLPGDKQPIDELFRGVGEGERNDALARICGSYIQKNWSPQEVLQACLTWNTWNKPPLSEEEVRGTVESIHATHIRNHPGLNPPERKGENSIPAPIESDRARSEFWTPVRITELKDAPPIDWVWGGYIARGRITELVGLWKSGKTTLVVHLFREMAKGGELIGKKVAQARVLIISEEDSSEWKDRKEEYGLGDNIDLICLPFKTKPSRKEWEAFVKHIDKLVSSYDLIVIDTIATNWPVKDENSNSEVIEAMMPIRYWTEQRIGVLILHHSRKGDGNECQASRGAGGLPAFVDIILEFRRYDPSREDDTRRTIKGYSRRKETPREVVIELIDDNYKLLGTKSETKATERLETLLSQLPTTEPGATGEEMKDDWPSELRPGIRTLKEDLETLHREGKIKRTGAGKKGSPYRYWSGNAIPAGPTPIVQESNFPEIEEPDLTEVTL